MAEQNPIQTLIEELEQKLNLDLVKSRAAAGIVRPVPPPEAPKPIKK